MKPTAKQKAERRSNIMRAVKSRHTSPELAIRKIAYAFAPGYRLHRRDLPGNPDIAYIGRKRAIFANGCFWHGHHCPRGDRLPKTNTLYWSNKVQRNRKRDAENLGKIRAISWTALTVWECELKDIDKVRKKLRRFLKA